MKSKLKTLDEIMAGELPNFDADAYDAACEILFDAYEEFVGEGLRKPAIRALNMSPYHADAYVVLGRLAKDKNEALKIYERGAQVWEKAFAKDFKNDIGHYWGIMKRAHTCEHCITKR